VGWGVLSPGNPDAALRTVAFGGAGMVTYLVLARYAMRYG